MDIEADRWAPALAGLVATTVGHERKVTVGEPWVNHGWVTDVLAAQVTTNA